MSQSTTEQIGLCELCENIKELCKTSHIIPKKIWNYVKKEEKSALIFTEDKFPKHTQSGIHERNILCFECEQLLGNYEKYGQNFIKDLENGNYNSTVIDEIKYFQIDNFDYKKFKLFFMSILFKISISKHSFFAGINLGKWQNKLQNNILKEDPGDKFNFATHIIRFEGREAYLIPNPVSVRHESINYCEFRLSNYCVSIKVDQRNKNNLFKRISISPDSPLIIPCINYKQTGDYRAIVGNIDKYKTKYKAR